MSRGKCKKTNAFSVLKGLLHAESLTTSPASSLIILVDQQIPVSKAGCGLPMYEECLSIQKCSDLHHNDLHSHTYTAHFKNGLSEKHPAQVQIERLEAVLSGADNTGTLFVCPPFMRPNRLSKGLISTFPDLKFAYTAKHSADIADFIPKECFMFWGVLDILLHHLTVISETDMGSDSDSSNEDKAVENSHQRPLIKSLGSVMIIACIHKTVLYCVVIILIPLMPTLVTDKKPSVLWWSIVSLL